ncbi:transposon I factor [Paraphaeosphaeria minitans]|uniref:Transposon I factor n=1 Tax=Paraphaeosphaeria minitans TaxID=565426 RepID=A0A9P6KP80_9PLEO|nr:transposon I factor [Paraphaeosphaeria minitans]
MIASAHEDVDTSHMETIMPYVISPWSKRITTTAEPDLEKATALVRQEDGIKIATSTSARRGNVGAGSAILGPREEQNPYVAELFAIVVRQPRRQSGQHIIQRIYRTIQDLEMLENKVDLIWITKAAKRTTQEGNTPSVRAYSKRIDAALPGQHTRKLYDNLSRQEATIRAADSRACACGHTETPEHFLFRCARWDTLREQMLEQSDTLRGSLSFYLGGRAKKDPAKTWAPSIEAVKATIRYAIATKRLETASGT